MSSPGASESLVGRTIGHYAVTGRLGEGGMGAVYTARDDRLHRDVAIKVIAPGAGSDPALAKRLLREARAASALNHPNIVTIHEIAQADGLDYIVMERVEGRSLAEMIPPGGLPIDQAIDLGIQIAGAIAMAHETQIVHRDLKPENVMVTPTGRVKVLDFGLARFHAPSVADETARTVAMPTQLTGTRAILGSVGYMSPEQIEGRPVQAPSDVFSLGILLYVMLTGSRPFTGDSDWAVLAATVQATPQPVQSLRPEVPAGLARIVARCLERRPEDRYLSAVALAEDLRALAHGRRRGATPRFTRAALFTGLVLAAIAITVTVWLLVRESRVRWARGTAIAELKQRTAKGDVVGAMVIARRAMAIAPQDDQLRDAWRHLVVRLDLESQPSGAEVAIHSYIGGDGWLPIGRTPLQQAFVPFGLLRWRFVRPGYDTLVIGRGGRGVLEAALVQSGTAPAGMVLVPSGPVEVESTSESVELPAFWLDRHEVTNRQYKAFVDAGGYRRREFWKEPFVRDGRTLSWEEAVSTFRDATGRPGPGTWEFGAYPTGHDDHPVTGVSWHEAAAYAAFAGRQLPTVYHWYRASGSQDVFSEIITQSNFNAKNPVPAGSMAGLGPFGTYDMAGNVKEWCWNAADSRRYILGGAWNELPYAFHDQDARSPLEREATFGFRCMLQREPLAARLTQPLHAFERDPASLVPVGDELFQAYRRLYDYDPTPLDARVESGIEQNPAWREELVTVNAAYGGERLP
ncbi:MAG TPA: protein kinase, partial [Candidatus Eisenbacteria bacterium]|nr:protein kinase [Candidatus Eisenbacteria bacterium]